MAVWLVLLTRVSHWLEKDGLLNALPSPIKLDRRLVNPFTRDASTCAASASPGDSRHIADWDVQQELRCKDRGYRRTITDTRVHMRLRED